MACKKCATLGITLCFCGALYVESVHGEFKEHIEEGTHLAFFTGQAPTGVTSTVASSVATHPFIFKTL